MEVGAPGTSEWIRTLEEEEEADKMDKEEINKERVK
jgi:hypothetical protein